QAEREVEQAEASLATRTLMVQQAKQRVAELSATVAKMESQRHQVPMKEADIVRAEAALAQARADLNFAELQLQYTEVRALVDGVVSRRTVEVGQVAQMGQPLLAIVPLHEVWVLANFKETQLARIRPGMTAEVRVDTFTDRVFRGTVDSLSAGTGARFSLLPPENATGNWVKVVQRLPVKIRLDPGQFSNPHTLRAGMSAVRTVPLRWRAVEKGPSALPQLPSRVDEGRRSRQHAQRGETTPRVRINLALVSRRPKPPLASNGEAAPCIWTLLSGLPRFRVPICVGPPTFCGCSSRLSFRQVIDSS